MHEISVHNAQIPGSIMYYYHWDKDKDRYIDKHNDTAVRSVFPCNPKSPGMMETGERWASKSYYEDGPDGDVVSRLLTNDPITGVTIVDLVKRSEGGRAWKVVYLVGNEYVLVDMREDTLLDAMKNKGVKKGGILNGSYLWAQFGSQMKLIRKDSDLYKRVHIKEKKASNKKIGKGSLQPGHLYEMGGGEKVLFLGRVATLELKWVNENKRRMEYPIIVQPVLHKDKLLWMEYRKWDKDTTAIGQLADCITYYFKLTKTSSCKVDHGISVSTSDGFLEDILDKLAANTLTSMWTPSVSVSSYDNEWHDTQIANRVPWYAEKVHMVSKGGIPQIHPQIKRWIEEHPELITLQGEDDELLAMGWSRNTVNHSN